MKRIFAFISILFILASVMSVSVFAYTADDGAGNLTENNNDPDETVNAEGDYINITGAMSSLGGTVGGDVLGFFTSFEADELEVGGSMRFIAVQTAITNTSCRNLTFLAGDALIGENVNTNAVFVFATGSVEFKGTCDVLTVYASDVVISGEVKNNAKIYADNVYFSDTAVINDVTVESARKPLLTDGKTSALSHDSFEDALKWKQVNVWKDTLVTLPSIILYAVSGALLIQFIFGKSTKESAVMFRERPFRFTLSGLMLLLSIPGFAVFMLMLSSEIATALLLVYLALIVVSQLFAGSVLAARLFPTMNRFLSAIIVTTTLAVLCALPYVGYAVTFACLLIAFGYFGIAVMSKKIPRRKVEEPKE